MSQLAALARQRVMSGSRLGARTPRPTEEELKAASEWLSSPENVRGEMRLWFKGDTKLEELLDHVLPSGVQARPDDLDRGIALCSALAVVSRGNARTAASIYDSLKAGRPGAETFAVQRLLASTGLGLDALRAVRPRTAHTAIANDDPRIKEILTQAEITGHNAAERLLADWPRGVRQPESIEEFAQVANEILHVYARSELPGELPDAFLKRPENGDRARLLANQENRGLLDALGDKNKLASPRQEIALRGLIAAVKLRQDPHSDLPSGLQLPYLAARNHVYDPRELLKIGGRFFKVLEYADRAAAGDGLSATIRQLFGGGHKNPLKAVAYGTVGQGLREPEEDFDKLRTAVGQLMTQLNKLAKSPGANQDTHVFRSVVLNEWIRQIGKNGWQNSMSMSGDSKQRIIESAATAFGIPTNDLLRKQPFKDFARKGITMKASVMREWANEADMGAEFEPSLAHFSRMENSGDSSFPENPTSNDYLLGVRDAMVSARMTYPVGYHNTVSRGINVAPYQVAREGVPSVYVGPTVRAVRTGSAAVDVGSSATAGQFIVSSTKGWAGSLGAAAIASWTINGFGPSLGAGLSFVGDTSEGTGAALRTRLHGPDLELWRRTLLSAFDAMYGVNADSRQVERPSDANRLLNQLANAHYKDPYLSLGPYSGRTENIGMVGSASASLRGRSEGSTSKAKGGLSANLAMSPMQSSRLSQDDAGSISTQAINHNKNVSLSASAGASVTTPLNAEANALSVFNVANSSAVMIPHSRGGTLRVSFENGRVAPTTVFDTEFTDVQGVLDHADYRRAEWLDWTVSHDNPALDLDEYLTRVAANAGSGKQLLAERRVIQPDARERLDLLLAMRAYAQRLPEGDRARKEQQIANSIMAITENDSSFGPRFFYALELNTDQRTLGASFFGELLRSNEVSTARQLSAYRADATPGRPRQAPVTAQPQLQSQSQPVAGPSTSWGRPGRT
jgi:hypothetical protein